jgi:predicted RNA polymerase sigma factor
MVALNHAVATAMVEGPAAGLALLRGLDADGRMQHHHRLHAVRAHLLEMAGDHEGAIDHYRAAAGRTTSVPERNYLMAKAGRLTGKVQSS